ncbi:hypothetical protein M0805_000206 [Coniferiporia weirii]|nr:hypothetical protein M0805_000206 [Coniferiporia weirii]
MSDSEHLSPLEEQLTLPEPEFQKGYDSPDTDLILISCDGQKFRVHSSIMGMASCFFKGMLDLPGSSVEAKETEPITMQEDGEVLKNILDIAYPDRAFFDFGDPPFYILRETCLAAEKYDMPGVMYSLQVFLRASLDRYSPIAAYVLACRFNWKEEARLASRASLSVDITEQRYMEELKLANGDDVIRLFQLRLLRRDALVAALSFEKEPENPSLIGWRQLLKAIECPCKSLRKHSNTPYLAVLKYQVLEKMEKYPDGSSLRADEFWDREELDGLWQFHCSCVFTPLVDKKKLRKELMRLLDSLNSSV